MSKLLKRLLVLALALVTIVSVCLAVSADDQATVTILFTHDLHSHFLPTSEDDGGTYGGYARLMTVINQQKEKYPDAILVDGGDFSMGSLFQTAYATSALELRLMGAMGYDVTTFGNHEYDYLPSGLASMLNAAVDSKDKLPYIVEANYLPPELGQAGYDDDSRAVWEALERYGVEDYIVIERGGIYFVVFGIFGFDAEACAPNSGMVLQDPATVAQAVVDKATAQVKNQYGAEPVVICLSHSGTEDGQGEDYELASKVNGIDLIISGHTHTTLEEAIVVNDTYIVSVAEYGKNLGVVQFTFQDGQPKFKGYNMIAIDEKVAEDQRIAALVESYKKDVEEKYLSMYGMTFDQIIVNNSYPFDSVKDVYATAHESTLGNLFSDAYKWAVEQATGKTVTVALTASGVVRETIPLGNVTVSDIFNTSSLGVGTEGELVAVYITGKDLKCALEVDASVYPIMNSAQLFFSGVEYSFNTNRMIFNKVDYARIRNNDGTLSEIQDDQLYMVVTGMYAGQMLGSVKESSFGLLNITPRDANGNPIDVADLKNFVVKDENGNPIKEWYAIASYIQTMGGTMDAKYSTTDGRKVVYSSWNPVKLLKAANKFTYIAIALIILLSLAIFFIVRAIVRRVKRRKA